MPLNESPSEKEGKFGIAKSYIFWLNPSMKVPPKRKGNVPSGCNRNNFRPSMKVPPKRKGNPGAAGKAEMKALSLNESPSEKEGKCQSLGLSLCTVHESLNESPSEKEGK